MFSIFNKKKEFFVVFFLNFDYFLNKYSAKFYILKIIAHSLLFFYFFLLFKLLKFVFFAKLFMKYSHVNNCC